MKLKMSVQEATKEDKAMESYRQDEMEKMRKRRKELSYHAPAGMGIKEEKNIFIIAMAASIMASLSIFSTRYMDCYEGLYWKNGAERTIIPEAIMPDFVEILGESFIGFKIVVALMIAAVVTHYAYHFEESKSIYTMRRLPSVWELHRRCLTLPVCGIIISLVTALALLLIYYDVYMAVTPEICITPGQWQKLWGKL